MMYLTAVAALFPDLGETGLTAWIAHGWITPGQAGDELVFHEIDIARIRLIYDLRTAMRIEDETIPVVLQLLDQVYELRGQLRSVVRAVEAQPDPVREAISALIN